MNRYLMVRAVTTASAIVMLLAGLTLVEVVDATSAKSIIIDAHWDRFQIRNLCSNDNRNVRLYLDFGDNGWVSGHTQDETNKSYLTSTPVRLLLFSR